MSVNQDVKDYAKSKGVKMWEVADELKISSNTLTRRMRYKLSIDYKKAIFDAIDNIANKKANSFMEKK